MHEHAAVQVARPNDELKAVDEKDGWHEVIIPVSLGYSTKFKAEEAALVC